MKNKAKIIIISVSVILSIAVIIFWGFHIRDPKINEYALMSLSQLQKASQTKKYSEAYELMSPSFKKNYTIGQFPKRCDLISKVFKDTNNIKYEFKHNKFFLFKNKEYGSLALGFERINGQWFCVGVERQGGRVRQHPPKKEESQ